MEQVVEKRKFEKKNRLIWFQHVHKAAGSTIVKTALLNGETLYPKHGNGNPLNDKNEEILLWEFSREELKSFVLDCFSKKITFICTEFGFPDVEFLKNEFGDEIIFVTCLRNPFDRIISNYIFDYYFHFNGGAPSLARYYPGNYSYNQPNYYALLFSQHDVVNDETFDQAVKNLSLFNIVSILELDPTFEVLRKILKWKNTITKRSNESHSIFKFSVRFLYQFSINTYLTVFGKQKRFKFNTTFLDYLIHVKCLLSKERYKFEQSFKRGNQLDFLLYDRFTEKFRLENFKNI